MNFSCALEWTGEWPRGPFGNRNIVGAVQVQQAPRVIGAVVYVGISANARHAEQLQLGSRHRDGDRERVIKARVGVKDDRERLCGGADRRAAR